MAVRATDVYYPDKSAVSENGRYRVDANSPENKNGAERKAFARDFSYGLTDLESAELLWTRTQGEDEASCWRVYVDNDGWVIIVTGWDELIFIDPKGNETGKVDILEDALSAEERDEYVHNTTAGPIWAGYSNWYFITVGERRLFIIRPWWDRRLVFDIEGGKTISEDKSIAAACKLYETEYVMRELEKGVAMHKEWETEIKYSDVGSVIKAAYLAGRMDLKEAVPSLRKLQDLKFAGSFTYGSSEYEPAEGKVDPSQWKTYTGRTVIHLSLRRLGSPPNLHACSAFEVHFEDYKKEYYYEPDTVPKNRTDHVGDVKAGMLPEEVIEVIGAPDFVNSGLWCYDIDTSDPYTLTIAWNKSGVAETNKVRPAFWKTDKWDQVIVY